MHIFSGNFQQILWLLEQHCKSLAMIRTDHYLLANAHQNNAQAYLFIFFYINLPDFKGRNIMMKDNHLTFVLFANRPHKPPVALLEKLKKKNNFTPLLSSYLQEENNKKEIIRCIQPTSPPPILQSKKKTKERLYVAGKLSLTVASLVCTLSNIGSDQEIRVESF